MRRLRREISISLLLKVVHEFLLVFKWNFPDTSTYLLVTKVWTFSYEMPFSSKQPKLYNITPPYWKNFTWNWMLLLLEMRNARVPKRFPPIKFAFTKLGLYYITAFHYVLHARGKFQMGNNRIGSLRFYAHVKAFEIGYFSSV